MVSPGMSMAALALVVGGSQHAVVQRGVAVACGEEQRVPCAGGPLVSPGPQGWQQVGRDRYRPDAGVRLGWADQELPLEPDDGLADVDHACVEVEVADPQPTDFAGP